MARAYTNRLAELSGTGATPGPITVYTTPVGIRTVVRDIVWTMTDPSQVLYVENAPPGGFRYRMATLFQVEGETGHMELRQAMLAGEPLIVTVTGTGSWNLAVTGYELLEDAPSA